MSVSIGTKLKEARLKRGLTFEEVAHETRINEANLRGLETDDYSAFSSMTYVRGFLGLYSNFLGVDADEILEAMQDPERAGPRPQEQEAINLTPQETRIPVIKGIPEPITARSVWVPILGFALILLLPTVFIFGKKMARLEIEETLRTRGLETPAFPGDIGTDLQDPTPAPVLRDPIGNREASNGSLTSKPLPIPDPDPELNALIGIDPP